jgi:hypothetical protein
VIGAAPQSSLEIAMSFPHPDQQPGLGLRLWRRIIFGIAMQAAVAAAAWAVTPRDVSAQEAHLSRGQYLLVTLAGWTTAR